MLREAIARLPCLVRAHGAERVGGGFASAAHFAHGGTLMERQFTDLVGELGPGPSCAGSPARIAALVLAGECGGTIPLLGPERAGTSIRAVGDGTAARSLPGGGLVQAFRLRGGVAIRAHDTDRCAGLPAGRQTCLVRLRPRHVSCAA